MGRKRIPEGIKRAHGTFRQDRQPNTVKITGCIPEKPAWLDLNASALWDKLAPELAREGLLCELYRDTFALLCQAWSNYLDAQKQISEKGMVIRTSRGNLKKNPWLAVGKTELYIFLALSKQFGLSPASKQSIYKEKPAPENPFKKLLQEKDLI